jgi:putative ATP-dependent endonuclease of OLD family
MRAITSAVPMKIESIRIQNFRAFKDQTISFNDYTCLVGPNGGGKSTVLMALNVFFRYSMDVVTNLVLLDEEDFHGRDTSQPISITVTFTNLTAEAQADFAGYFRQGKLIVSAKGEWSAATRSADVKQFGERLAVRAFAPFFLAEGDAAKVEEL